MMRHVLVYTLIALAACSVACRDEPPTPSEPPPVESPVPATPTPTPVPTPDPEPVDLGDGLSYRLLALGVGEAQFGTGTIGEFDLVVSSEGRTLWKGRFAFEPGTGQGFPGLERGTAGMKAGESRSIVMPSTLGPPAEYLGTPTGENVEVVATLREISQPTHEEEGNENP